MMAQYLRKSQLLVGSASSGVLDLSEMQFKFSIIRGDIQTPNTLTARIYNLAKNTANLLKSGEFTEISLKAGYQDNFGLLFVGSIKYVYFGHESSVDSYVEIVAGDGDQAYTYATVNMTLAAGSKPSDHVAVAAKAMQEYDVEFSPDGNPTFQGNALPRGKVFYGRARDVLRRTAQDFGLTWSIQDKNLGFVLETSYRPGDPVVLTSATGLIGFPEQTQNGILIRCLLNPAIKMGGAVKIDNTSVQRHNFGLSVSASASNMLIPSLDSDGLYKVLYAQHKGDTRGNDYYTDLTCISVDSTKNPLQSVGVSNQAMISRLTAGPPVPGPVNPYLGP